MQMLMSLRKNKLLHSPSPTKSIIQIVENKKFNWFSWVLSTIGGELKNQQ